MEGLHHRNPLKSEEEILVNNCLQKSPYKPQHKHKTQNTLLPPGESENFRQNWLACIKLTELEGKE